MRSLLWAAALITGLSVVTNTYAEHTNSDGNAFAKHYFDAWKATQKVGATEQALDAYLALLAEDVGHVHAPYDNDDTRHSSGKADMREGMRYYLGSHVAYEAELLDVIIGHNVVTIKYLTRSAGVHPQTKETLQLEYETVEVLEMEDGKVAVIRKYEA